MNVVLIDWQKFPPAVIEILLRDFNTGKKIFGGDVNSVVPRAQKSDDEKISRTRSIAEVFTPARVVKEMVDALDDESLFWQSCVEARWLEVACGEAPFVTTRYDAETGEFIPAENRVGILDRKLRAIPAAVDKLTWATRAVQSVYGFELQGDSLLIARANVLLTFAEFVEEISDDNLRDVAEIVSKNFWQMDGLNLPEAQTNLFYNAPDCKLVDWFDDERKFSFTGGNAMKFDFLVSNPPYQDDTNGKKVFAPPLYDKFMEAAHHAAEKVALITPARFLFNAGATPKDFNQRMLDDPHLKVLHYEQDAKNFFRNVDIEGGVAVTLHDTTKNFGAIGIFTAFEELNSIHQKVCVDNKNFQPLSKIISGRTPYLFTDKLHEDFPDAASKLSAGHAYDISSNVFEVLPEIFSDSGTENFCRILGRLRNERIYRWINREYVRGRGDGFIDKWKIFLPKANGASGKLVDGEAARIISKPVIGEPSEIATDTFLVVGAFETRDEAENCFAYIKSKFARVMLGILKVTQDNTADKWAKVPLQDFSSASDIDWRGDVDGQLYRKYNLSDAEISFIETHVKEMP